MNEPRKAPPAATGSADMQSLEGHAQDTAGGVSLPEANRWDIEDPVATEGHVPTWEEVVYQPRGFRRPPGLVGDIVDYVYCNAHRPMLEAAVMAALGLMAGVAGRAYNINGTGLNLYLLLLASQGRGKEAMANAIDSLITGVCESGAPMADDFLGPAEFASGQALLREVNERPCFLSVFGEFGIRLKALCDPRANPVEQVQQRILLDLYNKSGKTDVLRAKSHADREKNTKIVRSPAVSILGESTPAVIYENIGISEINSGLLPRFLILHCDSPRPPRNKNASCAPPKELVDKLRNLVATALQANAAGPGIAPAAIDVQIDEAAAIYLAAIEHDTDDTYNAAPESAEGQLSTRTLQNIFRVAALLAVGINHVAPVVTEECARWAADFVYLCVDNLSKRFTDGFIGTGEKRQEAELKKYIMEYLLMKPLKRHSYGVSKRIMNEKHIIPHNYLSRRAKQCTAFTNDRRGYARALDDALLALMKDGLLATVGAGKARDEYGINAKVYTFACNGDELREALVGGE